MKWPAKLLVAVGVLILLAPFLYIVLVNAALKSHGEKDQVIFGTREIHLAVSEYLQQHDRAPSDLAALVPDFLRSIPSFPPSAKLIYRVSDSGKEWTIDIVWTRNGVPLVFRRTNAQLSAEDASRQVGQENGCYILKDG